MPISDISPFIRSPRRRGRRASAASRGREPRDAEKRTASYRKGADDISEFESLALNYDVIYSSAWHLSLKEVLVAQFCGVLKLPPRPLWVQETMIGEARLRRRPQHRSLLSQQRRHVSVCDAAEQGAMLQFGLKLGHP